MSPLGAHLAVAGLVLLGIATQLSLAEKNEILDVNGRDMDLVSIAQVVCDTTKGADKQIGNPETISMITKLLQSVAGQDHNLAHCSRKYLKAFEQMQLVLDSGNDEVCGEAKVSAIENFHHSFMSKISKNKKAAPKALKLFFIHYVDAISNSCKKSGMKRLPVLEFDEE